MVKKIISGGQTGVDRAALDAAMAAGLPVGGTCPKGRLAEDGAIPDSYPLQEHAFEGYELRTEANVVESDGTLILNKEALTQGTKLTFDLAGKHLKPCLVVQLDADKIIEPYHVVGWIRAQQVAVLNIAGPRESKFPEGIYREAYRYLEELFTGIKEAM